MHTRANHSPQQGGTTGTWGSSVWLQISTISVCLSPAPTQEKFKELFKPMKAMR